MLHFGSLRLVGLGHLPCDRRLQRGLVIPVIPSEKPGEFQHGAGPEFALVLQRNDPQWSHLAWL